MSDLTKAEELEQLRVFGLITDLNAEEQAKIGEVNARMRSQGLSRSGPRLKALGDVRADKIRRLIDGRIKLRKELSSHVPELGSEECLNELLLQIKSTIANAFAGFHQSLDPGGLPPGVDGPRLDDHHRGQLEAHARREIEALKREFALNFHAKKSGPIGVISVHGGAAVINLGVIYGNVQQVIGKVGSEGYTELAGLLEQLASAISKTEALGNDRAAYLEQVQFIAEQASRPQNQRRASLVSGMFRGVQSGLQNVANLAQLAALLGPALAQHFGFQWPL